MATKKYKPHMMYCKDGSEKKAMTYKEHLALKKKGCGHSKPKDTDKVMKAEPGTTLGGKKPKRGTTLRKKPKSGDQGRVGKKPVKKTWEQHKAERSGQPNNDS